MRNAYVLPVILLCMVSCNEKPGGESTTKANDELVELSKAEADSISIADASNQVQPADTTNPLIKPTAAGRGATERQWRFLLKDVFQGYTFKNPVYLGLSNRKGVGTVLDRHQEVERVLSQSVDSTTYESFLMPANQGSLNAVSSKNFNFNIIVDADALGVDAELKNQIARSDSSRLITGSWKINELVWGNLRDAIKSNKFPGLNPYEQALNIKRNVIISKAVRIDSFTSEIFTSSDISAALKAKIDTSVARFKSLGGTISFKVTKKRTILAKSDGYFYVFGILSKKKTSE